MVKFEIGNVVKVVKPGPNDLWFKWWNFIHERAIGKEFIINYHYKAWNPIGVLGIALASVTKGDWYTFENFLDDPNLGFNKNWLELVSNSVPNSIKSCRCDLAKLMVRGCQCGAFKSAG